MINQHTKLLFEINKKIELGDTSIPRLMDV